MRAAGLLLPAASEGRLRETPLPSEGAGVSRVPRGVRSTRGGDLLDPIALVVRLPCVARC